MEEREREGVFTYVEVPILTSSPEGLGIYPWMAFPQGQKILLLILCVLVSHQGKKKEKASLCMWRDWYILMGSLEVWWCSLRRTPLVQEPPLQHNLLWPTLSGGNIIGLGGN
jgi:hypothetical protein